MIVWSSNHLTTAADKQVSEFLSSLPEHLQQQGAELFTTVVNEAYEDGYFLGVEEAEGD